MWPRSAGRGTDSAGEIIYLISLAGFPNYGDELITRMWLQHLANARPGATVVVDCPTPGQASLIHRGTHPNAVFVDTLWQLTLFAADSENDRTADWVAEAANSLGPAPRLAEGVDLFMRASTVHLVGGGYLNNVWPHHISLTAAVAEAKRRRSVKVYATGQGLIPAARGRHRDDLQRAAEVFDVFDLRDLASYDMLVDVPGASHTGDDAWLADPAERTALTGGVTLCLQRDLAEQFSWRGHTGIRGFVCAVRDMLDAWEVPGEQVTVVEGIPGLDFDAPALLGDRIAGATMVPFLDLWRNGIGPCLGNTWISTRFHPHLIAAAAGDSGVAIVPRPDYYGVKHQSLVDAGSQWTVLTPGMDAVPERPSAGGFGDADASRAREEKRQLAQLIYPQRRSR